MMNILPFLHGDEESASALHYAGAFRPASHSSSVSMRKLAHL